MHFRSVAKPTAAVLPLLLITDHAGSLIKQRIKPCRELNKESGDIPALQCVGVLAPMI